MRVAADELKTVFDELAQLSKEEQAHFAHLIREELEAEQAWERAFADPRSPQVLERMARDARAEREAGATEPLEALFDDGNADDGNADDGNADDGNAEGENAKGRD